MLLTAACGKEAPPLPPVIVVAERTTDLSAFQEGREAVLRWSYPKMTSSGDELPGIEVIEVWRVELPAGQEPPPPVTPQDRTVRRQLLSSQGEVVAELDPEQLAARTRGAELVFRDDLGRWSRAEDPDPAVLWYAVRTVCCRKRKSEFSNIARLEPQPPPPPPADLAAEAGADGVVVRWRLPDDLAALVERSPDGLRWRAVVDEPVAGREWLDTGAAQGRSWSYRLRSVRRLETGERVVGPPSEPVRVDHPDTYPPDPPEEIVCLPEGSRVRVRWQASPGAATYVVLRRLGGAEPVELAIGVQAVELTDDEPPLGDLTYLVAAVDEAGNRSPEAGCSVTMGALP